MAKIAIIVEYQPNPQHYPDCETVEECVQFDIDGLNNGDIDPLEFLDGDNDIEAKKVSDWNFGK